MGSLLIGCVPVGIYQTNNSESCFYISDHSKGELLVIENNQQLEKYVEIIKKLPSLKAIVMYNEENPDNTMIKKLGKPVYQWDEFLELGKDITSDDVEERSSAVLPGHCAILIYTSGTTGSPKAVMLSHDNLTWSAKNIYLNYFPNFTNKERIISFLPFSHIAAQMIDVYCMMLLGSCTYFAQPDAIKKTLPDTLKDVSPTIFFAVPHLWEKMQDKMIEKSNSMFFLKRWIINWALAQGRAKNEANQYSSWRWVPRTSRLTMISLFLGVVTLFYFLKPSFTMILAVSLSLYFLHLPQGRWIFVISTLPFRYSWFFSLSLFSLLFRFSIVGFRLAHPIIMQAKKQLGFQNVKVCVTGSAPIAEEVLWYFASYDIPIFELFGLSESTGAHTVSSYDNWRIGYCGRPLKGTISKIDEKNGNELCFRGRHLFMGYM
jgi:long-subunit acyl-CoA synthetase (AMP-forming)